MNLKHFNYGTKWVNQYRCWWRGWFGLYTGTSRRVNKNGIKDSIVGALQSGQMALVRR